MTGFWIVVGAGVLAGFSILLIGGSLWANASARKRARPQPLPTSSYATFLAPGPPVHEHTMIVAPPSANTVIMMPPRDQQTQFLSVDDMFAQADERVEPTRILAVDEMFDEEPEAEDPTMILRDEWLATPVEPAAPAPATPHSWARPPSAPFPRSSIPAASIPGSRSTPAPSKPTLSAPSQFAPPSPSDFVKPLVDAQPTPYAGYVAPRGQHDQDDDDDDDDDDPGTELVHQAELLRLMMKSRPPQ